MSSIINNGDKAEEWNFIHNWFIIKTKNTTVNCFWRSTIVWKKEKTHEAKFQVTPWRNYTQWDILCPKTREDNKANITHLKQEEWEEAT